MGVRRIPILAALCLLALAATGCRDSHEAATRDLLNAMTRMGNILTGVKDKDSAVAARDKVMSVAREIESIGSRLTALGDAPPAEKTRLETEYGPRLKEATATMFKEMKRVFDDPEVGPIIQPNLPAIGEVRSAPPAKASEPPPATKPQ